MYLSHFRLVKKPFQLNTDPTFLWLGEKHKEALATLKYGVIDQKGFLLVSGDVGTGKTTLINALLKDIGDDTLVANISDPALDLIEFFNVIALSFGMPDRFNSKIDFIVSFGQFLKKVYSENKKALLIIDEVHSLSKEVLEHIRLLSNIELPQEKLINIFLVGQNEIHQTLALPECRALRQRISLIYHIEPLTESETSEYIKHRLSVAGMANSVFSQHAVREIYNFSKGYPRLINTICDHALLTGYVRSVKKITPGMIKECAQQFAYTGGTINDSPAPPHPEDSSPHVLNGTAGSSVLSGISVSQAANQTQAKIRQKQIIARSEAANQGIDGPLFPNINKVLKKNIPWFAAASVALMILGITRLFHHPLPADHPPPEPPKQTASYPDKQYVHDISPEIRIKLPSSEKTELPKPSIFEQAKTALRNKDFSRSIVLFEQVSTGNPAETSALNKYYSKALRGQANKVLKNKPGEAKMLLLTAVEVDPENADAHFDLGQFYTKTKEYSKAIDAYQKAAQLDYRPSDTYYNLGFIYASIRDYANAEKMFLNVVALKPPYLDRVLFNLAVVQQKQGKKQECIENLEKAMNNNPDNKRAQDYLNQLKHYNEVT